MNANDQNLVDQYKRRAEVAENSNGDLSRRLYMLTDLVQLAFGVAFAADHLEEREWIGRLEKEAHLVPKDVREWVRSLPFFKGTGKP